jgi:hypothetical protein
MFIWSQYYLVWKLHRFCTVIFFLYCRVAMRVNLFIQLSFKEYIFLLIIPNFSKFKTAILFYCLQIFDIWPSTFWLPSEKRAGSNVQRVMARADQEDKAFAGGLSGPTMPPIIGYNLMMCKWRLGLVPIRSRIAHPRPPIFAENRRFLAKHPTVFNFSGLPPSRTCSLAL